MLGWKEETKGGDTWDKISRGEEPNERSRIDSFVTMTRRILDKAKAYQSQK